MAIFVVGPDKVPQLDVDRQLSQVELGVYYAPNVLLSAAMAAGFPMDGEFTKAWLHAYTAVMGGSQVTRNTLRTLALGREEAMLKRETAGISTHQLAITLPGGEGSCEWNQLVLDRALTRQMESAFLSLTKPQRTGRKRTLPAFITLIGQQPTEQGRSYTFKLGANTATLTFSYGLSGDIRAKTTTPIQLPLFGEHAAARSSREFEIRVVPSHPRRSRTGTRSERHGYMR